MHPTAGRDNDTVIPRLLLRSNYRAIVVCHTELISGLFASLNLIPKTGKHISNKPINIAIDCGTDLMYREGWYYLLGTHGTCCDGTNSTYNINEFMKVE